MGKGKRMKGETNIEIFKIMFNLSLTNESQKQFGTILNVIPFLNKFKYVNYILYYLISQSIHLLTR